MQTVKRASVHDFPDYRSFLRERYRELKKKNGKFSLGAWAKRLGMKGSSGLVMILKGQRNPGPELTESLISDLSLPQREAIYFRDLVTLEKCGSKDSPARFDIIERLSRMHPTKQFKSLSQEEFRAVSQWFYYAIRELVDLKDFCEDPEWIQKRLRIFVSQNDIKQALETLEKLGLLVREKGRLRYVTQVTSTHDIPDEGLKRFHEQMLNQAAGALRKVDVTNREISGLTFTIAKKDLPIAKELIRNLYREMTQLSRSEQDSVYQLEVALFPLTKDGGAK